MKLKLNKGDVVKSTFSETHYTVMIMSYTQNAPFYKKINTILNEY